MKILHICLACFYIDNYTYQENILPKYHKRMGYDVDILASMVSFDKNGKPCMLTGTKKYYNEYGIPVNRLHYKNPSLLFKRLRKYVGTLEKICESNPDIIFIHGCQFLDINCLVNYVKKNPNVKIYIDNHSDFSNSASNFISRNLLHRIIWKSCVKKIEPYVSKFYGVLPARVDFLNKMYSIPNEKIELLVMGLDDEIVDGFSKNNLSKRTRDKYHVSSNDFLVVTGGKIDNAKKQTLLLMKAIKQIKHPRIKIIVFGPVINELKESLNELVDGEKIQYVGPMTPEDSYKLFLSADLVVFPGRHSVFWEQVVGLGIPLMVKYWEGTNHIDIGGNCEFLYDDSVEEIKGKINALIKTEKYNKMREIAQGEGRKTFCYSQIALQSIEHQLRNQN